ncbi:MAG: outer membrane protein assembly factor BamB [Verrucomicrobiales bacterium]|jgi:outer membrane protein assembly factor BamB
MMTTRLLLCSIFGLAAYGTASADNWPQWRGPAGNGVVEGGAFPSKLSLEKNLQWSETLPGKGSSTPAVYDGKIFLTVPIDDQDSILCYSMEGKELWTKVLGKDRKGQRVHKNGSTSNPSPLVDADHVFVYFQSGRLAALTHDGEKKWEVNLQEKWGEDTLWWPLGSSPVLAGDNIVVAVMQEGPSYLVAFNRQTGELAWKTDRTYKTKQESDQSYTTPQLVGDVIVTWGADRLTGHAVKDGKKLWECGGFNPNDEAMWRVISSPAISDGIAVVAYGRTQMIAGVKLGGKGNVTMENRLWEREGKKNFGADCPSPVAKDGRAYVLTDRGVIRCLDLKSGEDIWEEELPRSSNKFYSSPILAGDVLYAGREDGTLFSVRLEKEGMALLSEVDLGGSIIAAPVPVDGKLLVRAGKKLFCFSGSKRKF